MCGNSGPIKFCFLPCQVDYSSNHFIVRDPNHFACYIYNHGQSDTSVTTTEFIALITSFATTTATTVADANKNRLCNSLLLGADSWNSISNGLYSNENPVYVCYPFCDDYNFNDYETTDDIKPCLIEYHGTAMETMISRFVRLIQPPVENDKELCPVTGLNDKRNNCNSDSGIKRLCRANRPVLITKT